MQAAGFASASSRSRLAEAFEQLWPERGMIETVIAGRNERLATQLVAATRQAAADHLKSQLLRIALTRPRSRLIGDPEFLDWFGGFVSELATTQHIAAGATLPRFAIASALLTGAAATVEVTAESDGSVRLPGYDGALALSPGLANSTVDISVVDGDPAPNLADATRRTEIRDGDRVVEYSVREYRRMRSSALVGDSALIRHHLDEAAFGRARTDATIRAPDEQLASEVARAFELLDRIDPRWTPPFEFLAKWIVGIDSPILYSTSFYSLPGVVVFRVAPDDPLWNAELILHEAAHNWLHELMRISPLMTLESSSRPVRSPWRADMRPLRGVLVGAHAFLIVASLMTRLWARHEEPQAAVAQRAVIELGRASTGMTMLARRAEWTTDGARFFSTLRRVESDVRDEQENLRRQSVELLAQPARHAWPTHGV